jgi:Fe-S-cluster-containing hydrogenase component 2/CRP-like cAMP-binding protein
MQVQSRQTQHPVVVGIQHRRDLVPLTEDEVRFEIDMCIGCDRCMKACPVPLSAMVNIADLNLATTSDEIAPHVARFTDECVMCGSCVPVCPVNNHRDLLMLSLKQRLGIPWDGKVDMGKIMDTMPQGWDVQKLLQRMREHPIFSNAQEIPDNYLLHCIASSKIRQCSPGTVLLKEGDFGREMFFILEGRFLISSLGPDKENLPVAQLRRGEFMGERGMLTGQPRNATAQALTDAIVLEAPEQVIQRMMEIVPSVHSYFEGLNNARSIEAFLKRMALFQGVSAPDIQWIARKIQFKTYDRNELLFAEKDQGQPSRETLHLILEGFVKVARQTTPGTGQSKSGERIIAYRQSGDYFIGGLDLLGDGRAVSVIAINRVAVAEIARRDMLSILERYPEVNQRFQMRLQEYREMANAAQTFIGTLDFLHPRAPQAPIHAEAETRAGLRAIVGNGVIEGTEVLVIDLDKCVQCDKCEEACERRHGHSRMNRKGMVVGNISIATACRQCQDPVCMLCSRAGIARMPGGEVYITESCIGCGICAERCPYDNISIVSLANEAEERSAWQRFANFFVHGSGKERGKSALPVVQRSHVAPGPFDRALPLDPLEEIRKKVAIKCDLCAGYDNQACVQACPTGAACRVQPTQFFGSTEDILRHRVE